MFSPAYSGQGFKVIQKENMSNFNVGDKVTIVWGAYTCGEESGTVVRVNHNAKNPYNVITVKPDSRNKSRMFSSSGLHSQDGKTKIIHR